MSISFISESRETAYIYAIFSAGVMYSVTRACSRGKLDRCGCDQNVRTVDTGGKFEWGGCSDNIRFGHRFSKEFVDSNEMRRSEKGLMNVWNNGAGRLVRQPCLVYILVYVWLCCSGTVPG